MEQTSSPHAHELEVFFDGGCPLCRSEIAFYQRRDVAGRIRFVDIADPRNPPPEGLSRGAALARFHVREADGRLRSGAAAFAALWSRVRGFRTLSRIARRPLVLAVLELGYRAFLPIRPGVSRLYGRLKGDRCAAQSGCRVDPT